MDSLRCAPLNTSAGQREGMGDAIPECTRAPLPFLCQFDQEPCSSELCVSEIDGQQSCAAMEV